LSDVSGTGPRFAVSEPAKIAFAVVLVTGFYVYALVDRLGHFPGAASGFGFYPHVLLQAPLATRLHLAAGALAVLTGVFQLLARKGTMRHRVVGYAWAVVMVVLCASALRIREGSGMLEALAVVVMVLLARAVWLARRHRVAEHAHLMRVLVLGATLAVGLFTALPGRVSWNMFFSGAATAVSTAAP
jgi:uncharacterized membrane protein